MMDSVVTIIPADLVVTGVDTIDRAGKIVFRVFFIDKRMLSPIAQHHHHSCENKRYNENEKSSLEIYEAHSHAKYIECYFTISKPQIKFFSFLIKEIHKRVPETQE
jgi:hypothetical protein